MLFSTCFSSSDHYPIQDADKAPGQVSSVAVGHWEDLVDAAVASHLGWEGSSGLVWEGSFEPEVPAHRVPVVSKGTPAAAVLAAEDHRVPIDFEGVAAAGHADLVGAGRMEFPFSEVDIQEDNRHTEAEFVVHTVPGLEGHRSAPIKSILVAVHFLHHRRLRIPS